MDAGILLVREADDYRVLFGHHRLKANLTIRNELFVDVKWENGGAQVVRTVDGAQASEDSGKLPLKHSIHCNRQTKKMSALFNHCHTRA